MRAARDSGVSRAAASLTSRLLKSAHFIRQRQASCRSEPAAPPLGPGATADRAGATVVKRAHPRGETVRTVDEEGLLAAGAGRLSVSMWRRIAAISSWSRPRFGIRTPRYLASSFVAIGSPSVSI